MTEQDIHAPGAFNLSALNDFETAIVEEALSWVDPDANASDDDAMVHHLLRIISRLTQNLPTPPDEMDEDDGEEMYCESCGNPVMEAYLTNDGYCHDCAIKARRAKISTERAREEQEFMENDDEDSIE